VRRSRDAEMDRGEYGFRRLLPHGDEHEFRLNAGDQIKIPITMQKRHACKNSVRRYQAVIRGTWSYARPLAPRVQMRCAARCFPSVGCDHHWQLAEYPIPARESVRAISALENFLQNRRREPDWLSLFQGFGEQHNFDEVVTAEVRNPHRRIDEHITSLRRACCLGIVAFRNTARAAQRENS
jgi:hypothetical protein